MATRIVRFILPATLLAAGCTAGVWTWRMVQHVDALERTGRQNSARIDRLQGLLQDVAEQELMYVASGQVDGTTLAATSSVLRQIVSEHSSLLTRSLAMDTAAARAVAEAATTITEIEARARENAHAGLELTAADLVFTETHSARLGMQRQLRVLRTAETAAVTAARSDALKKAWAALAGVALLIAWALIRWSRVPAGAPANAVVSILPDIQGSPAAHPPRSSPVHGADLGEAADLCTAIGRLKDEADLPALLARSATLLEATSVVIWMAAGDELFPAAGHGYDQGQLNRLGPIGRGAANATAAAWRSGALQTVAGDSTSRAAVVAPMLGPERCVGVLTVEVAPGREADESTRAVATLIAAQLAAALGAWPATSSAPTADVAPFERAASVPT